MNYTVQHWPKYDEKGKRIGCTVSPAPGTVVTTSNGRNYMVMDDGSLRRMGHGKKKKG